MITVLILLYLNIESNAVLQRHRAFLSDLEQQKQGEIDQKWVDKEGKKY